MKNIPVIVLSTALLIISSHVKALHNSFSSPSCDTSPDVMEFSTRNVMNINNILNPVESGTFPSPLAKSTFLEPNTDDNIDTSDEVQGEKSLPPVKKTGKTLSGYSHLKPNQKKEILLYIKKYPDAKAKAVSAYAQSLGIVLSDKAIYSLKSRVKRGSFSYKHLTPDQRKKIKLFMQDNPDSDNKSILDYVHSQGIELSLNALVKFKDVLNRSSHAYGYLTPAQKATIRKCIEDNPNFDNEAVYQYVKSLKIPLSLHAVKQFRSNFNRQNGGVKHLKPDETQNLIQHIHKNPKIKPKDLAQYANLQGIILTPRAASNFLQKQRQSLRIGSQVESANK